VDVFASHAGSDQPLLPPEGEKARVDGQCLGTFFYCARQKSRCAAYLAGCPHRSTTIHHVVGPIDRGVDLHHRSVDLCAVAIWQISLPSKAGRTRPPVVCGWLGPVLSSFVTASLESGTNCLRPDIRVGRVVASVRDPALEMSLPFGRRDPPLVRSGSAAVLRVDAVRGSPDSDFTKKGGGQMVARRCPYGLILAVAGAVSDLICEAGNEL